MSDFQRRHYEQLAKFWKGELAKGDSTTRSMYNEFVCMLSQENSNFKRDRFDKASGYAD